MLAQDIEIKDLHENWTISLFIYYNQPTPAPYETLWCYLWLFFPFSYPLRDFTLLFCWVRKTHKTSPAKLHQLLHGFLEFILPWPNGFSNFLHFLSPHTLRHSLAFSIKCRKEQDVELASSSLLEPSGAIQVISMTPWVLGEVAFIPCQTQSGKLLAGWPSFRLLPSIQVTFDIGTNLAELELAWESWNVKLNLSSFVLNS